MKGGGIGTFKATPKMRELVDQVLTSGQISYGPLSLQFEKRFAKLHDSEYAILSNSGTSALHVALQALKEVHHWERGQVIVPATTFVATANIVMHNDLIPVFVDVDPLTYNLDIGLFDRYITEDTRAIIPVHLFGQPAEMKAISEITRYRDIKIIEDSCETMYVGHAGKVVGSWGDIGCFSMYVAHLLVAGVGGISTTSDPRYAGKMRSLVNHGLMLDCLNPGENFAPQPMIGRKFRFDAHGHSYRITELEAALALAQLDDYEQMLATRARNARHLSAGLTLINEGFGDWFQIPHIAPDTEHSWMMYPVVLKQGNKDEFTYKLNERGIETRDMLPLVNQPAFRWLNQHDYPVSHHLIENGFYVGCHQDLTPEDIGYVVDSFGIIADPAYQGTHL